MEIKLSPDEARDFERRVREWVDARTSYADDIMREGSETYGPYKYRMMSPYYPEAMHQFEARRPFPRLTDPT